MIQFYNGNVNALCERAFRRDCTVCLFCIFYLKHVNVLQYYGLCGYDVFLLALVEPWNSLHSNVVGFRSSTCEYNLPMVCPNQVCHLLESNSILSKIILFYSIYSNRGTRCQIFERVTLFIGAVCYDNDSAPEKDLGI